MFSFEFHGEVNHEETSHGATLWWKLHEQPSTVFDWSTPVTDVRMDYSIIICCSALKTMSAYYAGTELHIGRYVRRACVSRTVLLHSETDTYTQRSME